MDPTTDDPDEFLQSLPDDRRADMVALDAAIRAAMPTRPRTVWRGKLWGGTAQTILGYGTLRQPRPRGEPVEWFVVGLALQRRHLSLYVNAVEDGAYLTKTLGPALGKVRLGASSIGFNRAADLDEEALTTLLRRADALCPPEADAAG
jgi:hypothetical protein